MNSALGNYRTTLCAFISTSLLALGAVPEMAPYAKILSIAAAFFANLGLLLAKDASTGSKPGGTA